jgi:lysyl-tRNA synthetase class 2
MGFGKRYARVVAGLYCAAAAEAFVHTVPMGGRLPRSVRQAVCPAVPSLGGSEAPALAHARAARRAGAASAVVMMAAVDAAALEAQIEEQGNTVRAMKEAIKADENAHTKAELTAEIDKLKALKAQLSPPEPKAAAKQPAAKKPAAKKAKKEEVKVSPREERSVRIAKADKFRQKGMNPYEYTWDVTDSCTKLQEVHKDLGSGEVAEGSSTSIAGRVMAKRVFGKLAFYTLSDSAGEIQLYLEEAAIKEAGGDESFEDLKTLVDVGDWIGVQGGIKRTDKGELSVMVSKWAMLTKTILPLPDKFKGLTDVNIRYRRRYVDLIVNSEVRETFRKRAAIVQGVRSYLTDRDYIEIETPVMNGDIGGADARPFITHHNALDMPLYLRIATELHLKRMVVGGFERVFELGRIFRNEGVSTRHNPEFTSVELYEAYADYEDMIRITEDIICENALKVCGSLDIEYQGTPISLQRPWRRVSMNDLVTEATGIDFYSMRDDFKGAQAKALELGIDGADSARSVGEIINKAFEDKCEASLIQPTFVCEHPKEISPLAKPHRSKEGLTERFELFIYGREHANGFSELTDPIDQRERFEAQAAKKEAGDLEAADVDEDFLMAIEYGMPPTAGLGIGIDRVVMLLTNSASIRDVIAFPLMRPEEGAASLLEE